jgi:hypothetical protein
MTQEMLMLVCRLYVSHPSILVAAVECLFLLHCTCLPLQPTCQSNPSVAIGGQCGVPFNGCGGSCVNACASGSSCVAGKCMVREHVIDSCFEAVRSSYVSALTLRCLGFGAIID